MSKILSSNLGYPRIGEKREWKRVLEQYWAGKLEKEVFLGKMEDLPASTFTNYYNRQLPTNTGSEK